VRTCTLWCPTRLHRGAPGSRPRDAREHSWGDGAGVRCAGARSRKVPVLEAAAQVSPRGLVSPSAAACVACVLAAAAAAAPAFACAVFLAACLVCLVMRRSMKKGRAAAAPARKATGAKSAHRRIPPPPSHINGEGYAVSYNACASVVLDGSPR
jgi:hypothetical protein